MATPTQFPEAPAAPLAPQPEWVLLMRTGYLLLALTSTIFLWENPQGLFDWVFFLVECLIVVGPLLVLMYVRPRRWLLWVNMGIGAAGAIAIGSLIWDLMIWKPEDSYSKELTDWGDWAFVAVLCMFVAICVGALQAYRSTRRPPAAAD